MQNARRIAAVLFGLLLGGSAEAQSWLEGNTVQFSEGAVMLASGAVVKGEISLDRTNNKIALRMANDTIYTIPAAAVRIFAVRGEQAAQSQLKRGQYVTLTRIFRSYSYPWSVKKAPDFKLWAFFEQLSEGPVMLLRREQPVQYSNTIVSANQRANFYTHTELMTTFYLSINQGKLVTLRKPKRDLLAFFPKQAQQIKAYAKENELSYKNARELAFIVNYANSLQTPKPQNEALNPE